MFIDFTSDKYWEQRKADKRTLLGFTYWMAFYLVLIAGIVQGSNLFTVPAWLEQIWIYLIFIPIILTCISIFFARAHGLVYIISRILRFDYKGSIVSKGLEKIFIYIFPSQLYTKPSFKGTGFWSIQDRGIYFGVIVNIFVIIAVILFSIFTDFEWIRSSVYDNTAILKHVIKFFTDRQTRW